MLKESLWHEIDALPETQLEKLWDFVQFLQYTAHKKTEKQNISKRIPGLDANTAWMSDDFDDPLPDAFWLGDDINDETPA
jgi:hypothetical protein